MTLEQLIATKAMELVQLLKHHKDYATLMDLQDCKYCENGNLLVPFIFANDASCEVHYADHCPVCGRDLT